MKHRVAPESMHRSLTRVNASKRRSGYAEWRPDAGFVWHADLAVEEAKRPPPEWTVDGDVVRRVLRRCESAPSSHHDAAAAKKPGEVVCPGDPSYELVRCMQLGIRHSVERMDHISNCELEEAEFNFSPKFCMCFPPGGTDVTPSHSWDEFRWKDYCPSVFRDLRDLFKINPVEYTEALCNTMLRKMASPGKSRSSFYLSEDDQFIIKTMKKHEVTVLLRMLPKYCQHVKEYKDSLLTKFYGVHSIKKAGSPQQVRLVIMGNFFHTNYPIHRRFDLKGSSHGRMTKDTKEIDELTTLKDLDLNFVFRLQRLQYEKLMKQVKIDTRFLEDQSIIDYSFLVGVHFHDEFSLAKSKLEPLSSTERSCEPIFFVDDCSSGSLESGGQEQERRIDGRQLQVRLGSHTKARAEHITSHFVSELPNWRLLARSHSDGEMFDVVMFFGIIDILQDYDIVKKIEHVCKSWTANPNDISVVSPDHYSTRFQSFIGRVFKQEDD